MRDTIILLLGSSVAQVVSVLLFLLIIGSGDTNEAVIELSDKQIIELYRSK